MTQMTEKIIHEVRFVETDDGFRIEVKGDKERMREMKEHMYDMGRMRHRRHFHGGFGPGPRFARHFGWWWGPWWDEEDEGEPTQEHSAQA
jgi:hypothetical protein